MRKFSLFLIGAIIGGLVGSTFALLLAPSSGDQLRGLVQEYITTVSDEVKQAAAQKRAELEQQLAQLRLPKAE